MSMGNQTATRMPDNEVLIITDLQNDFCPGGALAVPRGDEIIPLINTVAEKNLSCHSHSGLAPASTPVICF